MRPPGEVRDPVLAVVTVIVGVIVGLTFLFGFGNVLALALRLGVSAWVAPLVAPAVDLSVVGHVGTRHLAVHGAAEDVLRPAKRLLLAASVVTLALNVAEPVCAGQSGSFGAAQISPEVVHKSDVGGVELDVTSENAAAAWTKIEKSVTESVPNARIDGMVVTPMMNKGVELLVGVTSDPVFGPVVAFGSGGVMVEALRDVSFRAAPFTRLEAREMIDETIAARMLDGYRGLPRVDLDRLAAFLVRVGDFAATNPDLVELDLNPVIAADGDIRPVDVRIVLKRNRLV